MADTFLFVALGMAAPVYFLPTACAYLSRKRGAAVFMLLNFLLIGLWLLTMSTRASTSPASLAMLPFSLDVTLALWLALLHFSLRPEAPRREDVDEHVKLVEHDPDWVNAFSAESGRIVSTLSLPADILEHIGSTAVPGLRAKPVVDMMLGVPKFPPARDLLSRLQILGYENLGEAGVPGRVYLRLRGERDFNLHLVLRGGDHWRNNLALRELLRADPGARTRYAEGKTRALEAGGDRLLGYSDAKAAVVDQLLSRVRGR